jgi:hypothetical protein
LPNHNLVSVALGADQIGHDPHGPIDVRQQLQPVVGFRGERAQEGPHPAWQHRTVDERLREWRARLWQYWM